MNTLTMNRLTLSTVAIVMSSVMGVAHATAVVEYRNKTKPITEAEVLAAQSAWGKALVQISTDYETGGINKAKETASNVLDQAYAYNMGAVLFKPTLTTDPQTFRTTKEGALAYFVGANPKYPSDSGFALKGWRDYKVENAAIHLNGNTALSMGKVHLTDKTGKVTTVDKSWGYVRDAQGQLRIHLHHSSLPYQN